MKEVWKEIPDYPGYEISNLGKVRTYWRRDKLVEQPRLRVVVYSGQDKRPAIGLKRFDGKIVINYIHRLLLISFVEPCPDGMECCHYDGNIFNNNLSNLRWDYPRNNQLDKRRHETSVDGERNPMAKLTEKDIIDIREQYHKGISGSQLAEKYKVHVPAILRITTGQRWGQFGGPIHQAGDHAGKRQRKGKDNHFFGQNFSGSLNANSKLKERDVLFIREQLAKGVHPKTLAGQFNVCNGSICHIRDRISWKHI